MTPKRALSKDAAFAQIDAHVAALAAGPDARARLKIARALAFAASSVAHSRAPLDPAEMERGSRALALARANGATNAGLGRAIAVLSRRRLDALGLLDAPVLAEARGVVDVEAGCVAAWGSPPGPDWWRWNEAQTLDAANGGRALVVPIGGDGSFRATLRVIDGAEPALTPAEYRSLADATPIVGLRLSDGALGFGAPEAASAGLHLTLASTWARVRIFLLVAAGRPTLVAVACAAEGVEPALTAAPRFEV